MKEDIFKFWSQLELGQKVHPADADVLRHTRHHFELACLPSPYGGRLLTAQVVLLFLNPGFSKPDLTAARSLSGRKHCLEKLKGRSDFPDELEHPNALKWLKSRTKFLGDWENIRRRVAILELCPYHSKEFKDQALLAALPSVRKMLEWAQEQLFVDAIKRRRIVICMRSPKFWGLQAGKRRGFLFAPETNRGGFALKECEIANAATRTVNRLVLSAV
ncbi:MAG: hypothetical protein AB1342_14190 [Pseudomonadota bacterium]